MSESTSTKDIDLLARGWDAGYDAAIAMTEGAIFRLMAEGPKALTSVKRPANPYRLDGN